ncbi:MAG: hypothetical protein AAGL90_01155 [Pseudomonadota bacterium]
MTSATIDETGVSAKYWLTGWPAKVVTGLCSLIAVLLAVNTASSVPEAGGVSGFDAHVSRLVSFAALTVWVTFAIGIRRRGAAAMIALGFSIVVELLIGPAHQGDASTVVSANLGIVLAYCGTQLYWLTLVKQRQADELHPATT